MTEDAIGVVFAAFNQKVRSMAQRLHLVFGGELEDPSKTVFKDVDDIHIVGMFPDYDSAYAAWKAESGEAEALQEDLTAQRLALQNYPAAAALKELLARESGKPSWRTVRPPFQTLADDKAAQLVADMENVSFKLPALAA